MPIEEAGGYCDYCQKPVLGRRQGVNHVLYAILTIFSCGIWGLVWFLQSAFGGGQYACPTCGGFVRAGARAPLPPPDPNAVALPVAPQGKSRLTSIVVGFAAVWTISLAIILGSAYRAHKIETTPLVYPSPSPSPTVAPEVVLTDSNELRAARMALFQSVLFYQSRNCAEVSRALMKRRGPITAWTVTCIPRGSYLLEYNAKGELVGTSPVTP